MAILTLAMVLTGCRAKTESDVTIIDWTGEVVTGEAKETAMTTEGNLSSQSRYVNVWWL